MSADRPEQAATVTPGKAAYLATVTQAVIDGHGISEYPAYEHLKPWQRKRWEAAAQAAIEASPVDPADLLIAAERARDEAIDERDSLTERVAELVTEVNELRARLRGLLTILTEGDEDDETVRERATAQVRMMLADGEPAVVTAGTEHPDEETQP